MRNLEINEVRQMCVAAGGVRPLARLLGVDKSTVVRWLSGDRPCHERWWAATVELLRRKGKVLELYEVIK